MNEQQKLENFHVDRTCVLKLLWLDILLEHEQ